MKKSIPVMILFVFCSILAFTQIAPKKTSQAVNPEDFSIFQSRFFSDSSYQSSRITFPLDFIKPDAYPRKIEKGSWKFGEHLHWSSTNPSDIHFRLIETVESGNDKVIHGRLDNGGFENYTFSLRNGQWMLVKMEIPDL
jgi:hypothetical protein